MLECHTSKIERGGTYVSGIGFALDDIKNGDVAALFAWICRHHPVLWLQKGGA